MISNPVLLELSPKLLWSFDIDTLQDALIDYPHGVNLSQFAKDQITAELALRRVWAE